MAFPSTHNSLNKNSPDLPKLYEIEIRSKMIGLEWREEYRFVSLYNGTRGPWCVDVNSAKKHGKRHQEIIERLYHLDYLQKILDYEA